MREWGCDQPCLSGIIKFMQTDQGALAGIRVLDLSRVLAGPYCTQVLGDLGANVIKVERPQQGDDTRHWGPPFTAAGTSAYFISANRNKRSITIDLKTAAGREVVRRIARQCDVLVENFKTGDLAALELDYRTLSACHPGLIYCSITGFGQTGPRAEQAGYDFLIQAMGGLMSITGNPTDEGVKVGVAVADLFTGLWAVIAILAALQARAVSGHGQYIDLALYDCQLAMLANVASNWFISNVRPGRYGNAHPNIVPYQTFTACDGMFALAVGNDRQFQALCQALAVPALALDERFSTNAARVAHRSECVAALQEIFARMTCAEIIERCQCNGVPAGPIQAVDQAFADEQATLRNMTMTMPFEKEIIRLIGSPLKLSCTPIEYRLAPPRLGEHSQEILAEFGFSEQECASLRAERVVY
ncbi:MAG: CaiB/BaiF CoA-transferase family protein [Acidobacteriota bacterium]